MCEQNVEFFNVQPSGKQSDHRASEGRVTAHETYVHSLVVVSRVISLLCH